MRLIILVLFCVCSKVYAGTAEEKKVDAILDISGIYKQTMSLEEVLRGQIAENSKKSENKIEERVNNILTTEFHSEAFLAKIRNEMLKSLTTEELSALENFYQNPKIKNLTRMEEDAATPFGKKDFMNFLKESHGKKPDQERLKLYKKFDEETKAAKLSTLIVVDIYRNLTLSIDGKKLSDTELLALIKKTKPVMYENGSLRFLYVYRNATESEIEDYIRVHNKNQEMKKLMKILFDKYQEGFAEWAQNAGEKIKKLKLQR